MSISTLQFSDKGIQVNLRIIYKTPEGTVAILAPTQEAIDLYGIAAIALKDVPHGLSFKIVDSTVIPSDRTFRGAWEVDMTNPDGVGAESNEFPKGTA